MSTDQFDPDSMAEHLRQVQEEQGVDLSHMMPEPGESFQETIERLQYEQDTAPEDQGDDPDGRYADRPPSGNDDLLTGQTIHDAAHWMGKPAELTGEMVGGQFVATGSLGGGIIEDDVIPLEHRVITEGEEAGATWVLPDGTEIDDPNWGQGAEDQGEFYYLDESGSDGSDEEYESGYDDGFADGADQARSEYEEENYY